VVCYAAPIRVRSHVASAGETSNSGAALSPNRNSERDVGTWPDLAQAAARGLQRRVTRDGPLVSGCHELVELGGDRV